jgi:hypothetical protein
MNENAFRQHLKDLVHGHHHPEEHDWNQPRETVTRRAPPAKAGSKRRTVGKPLRKK